MTTDDLRALIIETLTTTPSEALNGDSDELDRHATKAGRRHDQHRYHMWCALCQGEADTLADAIVKALAGRSENTTVNVEVVTADCRATIWPGVRGIRSTLPLGADIVLDIAGNLHVPASANVRFLADDEIQASAYEADENAAEKTNPHP